MNTDPDARAWMDHAECMGMNPDLFMPNRGDNKTVTEAKAVCARCPVEGECLEYALDQNEKHGIWGGLSERQRRELRAKRGRQMARPTIAERMVAVMRPGVDYSADHLRLMLGHNSHTGIGEAIRALTAAGQIECTRQFRNSRAPALYQLCGGEPSG